MSRDRAIALQPGQQERNFVSKKKKYKVRQQGLVEKLQRHPEDVAEIFDEGGYTKQIFAVDGKAFHWKMMPSRTFIARKK